MISANTKLIAIVGPTGSGKTELAIGLAERFNGEIVCADSRTIYRGMDVGTAKPTRDEQLRVRHHLLDVVDPGETLNAATFKLLAEAAIEDIAGRGSIPFLVGGSGLYVDAVLFDYQFPPESDEVRRLELEAMSGDELRELLAAEDPEAYARIDVANRRRVIRALETVGQARMRSATVRDRTLVLGMGLNKEVVQEKIHRRIEKMLEEGLFEEIRKLGNKYGWESEAMSAVGYRGFEAVVLEQKSVEDWVAEFERGHIALVKKQLTWFKRNPAIVWINDAVEAEVLVERFLGQKS